ncbi:MAG: hypothetical protein COA69_03505 [Robiginitomaculum sp.]|nr:MAG: hypothetical protein COA69_03505 [Robiginitomaculum sp.]
MHMKMMMAIWATLALFSQTAQAQIISQTPRPEIQNPEADTIEIIKPNAPIGSSRNSIKIPRTGALLFAGFDQNGDYSIDTSEVSTGIDTAFDRADKDASGILSLIELEAWRIAALGSENATPTNFTFAPNFARTVSRKQFTSVLSKIAEDLDKDDQGDLDGKISMSDLLKNYTPRRVRKGKGDNCIDRLRAVRREVEQQCRRQRGY